jgi:hypothetical protein
MEMPEHLKKFEFRAEMFYPRFSGWGKNKEFIGWDLKDDAYNEMARIAELRICTELIEIKEAKGVKETKTETIIVEGVMAVVSAVEAMRNKDENEPRRNALAGVGSWEKPDHFIQFAETRARQRLISILLGITGFDVDKIATELEKEGLLKRDDARSRDDDRISRKTAEPRNIIEPTGTQVNVFDE